MIFSEKHSMYTKTLLGEKCLTTRLRLPAHIAVGKTWAIVPRRAAPAWWIADNVKNETPLVVVNPREYIQQTFYSDWKIDAADVTVRQCLKDGGFIQAAITVDAFTQSPLQEMDNHLARLDGFASVDAFRQVWDALNPRMTWEQNPLVWRISYHTPMDVHNAVLAVGRQAILDAGEAWRMAA